MSNTPKNIHLNTLEQRMRDNFRLIQLVSAMQHLSTTPTPPIHISSTNNHISQTQPQSQPQQNIAIIPPDNIIKVACMARRSDGQQCTKHKHTRVDPDTDYCNVHHKAQAYGRIDGIIPEGIRFRTRRTPYNILNTQSNHTKNKKKNINKPKSKSKPNPKSKSTLHPTNPNTHPKRKSRNNSPIPTTTIPKKRGRKRKHPIDPRFNDPTFITMWPDIISGEKRLVDRHDNVYTYNPSAPQLLGIKTVDNQLISLDTNTSTISNVKRTPKHTPKRTPKI